MASFRRVLPVLLLLALLPACARESPPPGTADGAEADSGAANVIPGRVFERAVVFLTSVGDSTLIVPWLFTARTKPGGVDRVARAWRDARVSKIWAGSNEIMKELIGRDLGL